MACQCFLQVRHKISPNKRVKLTHSAVLVCATWHKPHTASCATYPKRYAYK